MDPDTEQQYTGYKIQERKRRHGFIRAHCASESDLRAPESNQIKCEKTRKISLPNYYPTSDPWVLAKSSTTSTIDIIDNIIEEESDDEEFEINTDHKGEDKYRRKSHFQLPICEPIQTRQRSHSVNINTFNENTDDRDDDIEESDSELEFVGVREEILLIKSQFDKLMSVLDISHHVASVSNEDKK